MSDPDAGPILVVEDNVIVAMDAAAILEGAGFAPVVTVATVADAVAQIERRPPAAALLDVNLGDETSRAVAVLLIARGIPFGLTTGYTAPDGMDGFPDAPVLQKPYTEDGLRDLMRTLTS